MQQDCSLNCRKVPDRPRDPAKWNEIVDVAASLSIPIITNGDVFKYEDFQRTRDAIDIHRFKEEEPSQSEVFIATRIKMGKEVQEDSQIVTAELQNHQNSGETADDAFRAVFEKDKPGGLRSYGRSVTTSSLKRDEETNKIKQKHSNEVTSLKEEVREMREEMQYFFNQLVQNNP